ncbi:MAG: hypothetical protein PF448_02875 [Bacteroidales bacterium]|jgi:hypothetical protein|nr:hypothetical protein [Bacteroidales bacterium]
MKYKIFALTLFSIIFLGPTLSLQAQSAKKITNNKHAAYKKISGTQLYIVPPENYKESDRFNGYENILAGSSIMIFRVPGSVNENMVAFKRNKDIQKGMVVAREEMFLINGFDALLQAGVQFAHGKTYMRYVFVIGDMKNTYVFNASWYKDADFEKEAKRIRKALLGIIFVPEEDEAITEAFDFSVDFSACNLKPGNILMNSLVYTDDGQIPSQTEAKTAFMINESKIPFGEKHDNYLNKVIQSYPIDYSTKQDLEPKAIEVDGLPGLEFHAIGHNTKLNKSELIYIAVLFDGTTVYQLTGTSLKNFEARLPCFKKMARSFKRQE